MIGWWLLAGGVVGALNGLIMRSTIARLRPDAADSALALILVGAALRWVLIVGLLIGALQRGALEGLLAFVGLLLANSSLIVWWNRSGANVSET